MCTNYRSRARRGEDDILSGRSSSWQRDLPESVAALRTWTMRRYISPLGMWLFRPPAHCRTVNANVNNSAFQGYAGGPHCAGKHPKVGPERGWERTLGTILGYMAAGGGCGVASGSLRYLARVLDLPVCALAREKARHWAWRLTRWAL